MNMGGNRRRLGILTETAAIILGAVGIWMMVFLSFLPGMFLLIFALLIFLTVFGIVGRDEGGTRSFWVFDRNEKGKWEDIDRIIRR